MAEGWGADEDDREDSEQDQKGSQAGGAHRTDGSRPAEDEGRGKAPRASEAPLEIRLRKFRIEPREKRSEYTRCRVISARGCTAWNFLTITMNRTV